MPTIWSAEQVKKKQEFARVSWNKFDWAPPLLSLAMKAWQIHSAELLYVELCLLSDKKITSSSSQFHTWICTCRCSAEWANKTATNWSLCWSSCWWGLRLKTRKNHTCGKHISNWESLFVQTSVSSSTCRLPGPSRHNREDPPRRYGGSWPASERG